MHPEDRLPTYAGVAGVLVLLAGIGLAWWGIATAHAMATVPGILLAVAGLIGLRVRAWVRKERVLRRVGHDLHVPPPEE